jgi:hypothetical protein
MRQDDGRGATIVQYYVQVDVATALIGYGNGHVVHFGEDTLVGHKNLERLLCLAVHP